MASATAQELELHELILKKDDTAFSQVCILYFERVTKKIQNSFRRIHFSDDTLIYDIVVDSFYKYFNEPHRFNPEKQTLEKFLRMDAIGDMRNEWTKRNNQKIKRPVIRLDATKSSSDAALYKKLSDEYSPLDGMINKESNKELRKKIDLHFKTEADQDFALFILQKERKTKVYAEILKINHLPFSEQQDEIKRNKDRIKKILKKYFSEE